VSQPASGGGPSLIQASVRSPVKTEEKCEGQDAMRGQRGQDALRGQRGQDALRGQRGQDAMRGQDSGGFTHRHQIQEERRKCDGQTTG